MQAKLEKEKRELERSKSEKELRKREDEAWLQSENAEMPMFPLLEGPQQPARTAVALAAEAPAAEVMNGTRVFPDTAAPDASVARAARKLGSVLAFVWLVSITTGDSRVRHSCWTSFLMVIFTFKSAKVEVWFQLECAPEQLVFMVIVNWHFFYVATFFLWYPNLFICYSKMQ